METITPPEKKTKLLVSPVISKAELSLRAEELVLKDHMTYVEAVIQICNDLDVEPEDIAKLVTGPLKDKLEAEAQRSNILPKPSSLFSED